MSLRAVGKKLQPKANQFVTATQEGKLEKRRNPLFSSSSSSLVRFHSIRFGSDNDDDSGSHLAKRDSPALTNRHPAPLSLSLCLRLIGFFVEPTTQFRSFSENDPRPVLATTNEPRLRE